jgi:hypothetical protein
MSRDKGRLTPEKFRQFAEQLMVVRVLVEQDWVEDLGLKTRGSLVVFRAYKPLQRMGYSHTSVNHSILEFVKSGVQINTIEGFWSQAKRSLDGTHHCVSPKYLQQYVNEFVYRYNHRDVPIFP